MPYLKQKDFTIFRRGEDDFLFCEKKESELMVQFSDLEIKDAEDFSNATLHINSPDYKVVEAVEFDRDGVKYFRVTYILGSETLRSLEIEGTCTGQRSTSTMNNNSLSTLRWPFFAYLNDPWTIVISPLAKSNYFVYFDIREEIGLEDDHTITELKFTNEGSLVILTDGGEMETYYRLNVKSHFHNGS